MLTKFKGTLPKEKNVYSHVLPDKQTQPKVLTKLYPKIRDVLFTYGYLDLNSPDSHL